MQNLNEFLSKSKVRLQLILEQLEWTANDVKKEKNAVGIKKNDCCDDFEPPFPASIATQNSIVLDEDALKKLLNKETVRVPQTFSDLQVNFSRQEKMLVYEHVRNQIEKPLPSLDENDDLVSLADIVALKKREKKNRRKHRISKPTHIEELRALVELQMQSLEQCLRDKHSSKSFKETKNKNTSRSQSQFHKRNVNKSSEHKNRNDHQNQRKEKYVRTSKSSYEQHYANYSRNRSKDRKQQNYKESYRYKKDNKHRSRSRSHSSQRHLKRSKERPCKDKLHGSRSRDYRKSRSRDYRRSRSRDYCRSSSRDYRRSRSSQRHRNRRKDEREQNTDNTGQKIKKKKEEAVSNHRSHQ